jgi:dTDP-L-rhamnose 4-epimerase
LGKSVLVTGGAGFIGSFIVDELVRRGHKVRIFDNLDPQVHPGGKEPEHLNRDAEFIKGDVRDYEAFAKALDGIEVVSHHAGAVGVGQSQYQIKYYVDVNTGGTANMLDILANRKHKVEKVIVAASMSSYGEGMYECPTHGRVRPPIRTEEQMASGKWELNCPSCGSVLKPVPIPESADQMCNSIYAITKKDQEDMCLNIGKTYKIPTVAFRYFNVYGPRQSLSNPYTGVAAIFMSRIKNDKPPVIFEDGLQSRNFVSIHDIVHINMLAQESAGADYMSINVGSRDVLTIKAVAELLAKLYGKDIKPEITNRFRKGDVRHCFSDNTLAEKLLGFTNRVSFEDGMKELIEWSRKASAEDKFDTMAQEMKTKGLV